MHDLGLNSCIAVKKPFLNDNHKAERLAFAKEHTHEDWSKVIWTDEASFEIGKLSRQVHVWRKYHERYQWDCIVPSFKSGRSSIMVWGAITSSTKSYLVLIPPDKRIAKDFVEIVYKSTLEHFYYHHNNYQDPILMEDEAPVHRSKVPKFWRKEIGLKKLNWPANSPNLNPIENLWKQCKNRVQERNRPGNKDEMWILVSSVWEDIPQENISKLISTMPH